MVMIDICECRKLLKRCLHVGILEGSDDNKIYKIDNSVEKIVPILWYNKVPTRPHSNTKTSQPKRVKNVFDILILNQIFFLSKCFTIIQPPKNT